MQSISIVKLELLVAIRSPSSVNSSILREIATARYIHSVLFPSSARVRTETFYFLMFPSFPSARRLRPNSDPRTMLRSPGGWRWRIHRHEERLARPHRSWRRRI